MNNLPKILCTNLLRWSPSKQLLKTSLAHSNILRTLYAPSSLGMDAYVHMRDKTLAQFASGEDKFKLKMTEFSDENSRHMIFTEDLKSMIYLAEDKYEDLLLVHAMIRKFNKQNRELRFGSFIFGPVIMRMYYHLGKPDEALAAFKDQELSGIFDQIISFHILMELLFINQRYEEVIEVFNIVKDKQLQPHRYPRNIVVLFFAACYKLNTPESYKNAIEIWHDLKGSGGVPMRRAVTFATALALKQGAPHIALEMLSTEFQQQYVTVRNLKTWALANLGRADDVLPILRSVLSHDDPTGRKHTFTAETMDQVKEAMGRCSDKEVITEYERIEKQLYTHGLVVNDTLDSILCQEIAMVPMNQREGNQRSQMLAGSYNRRGSMGPAGGGRYKARPGLADLN